MNETGGNQEESFEVYDSEGRKTGRARRSEVHGNPKLIHRVAHVLVFNSKGQLYLQKRSDKKDIAPGKWDTSVGGHLLPKEGYLRAARREMAEELGIHEELELVHLFDHPWRSEVESEEVRTYAAVYDGPIQPDPEEISEGRFWSREEIRKEMGRGVFTPNLEQELRLYGEWLGMSGTGTT